MYEKRSILDSLISAYASAVAISVDHAIAPDCIFHQKDLRLLHWHKPKEFEWHGQMYDVKEQYLHGDSVHLLVWADKHETMVNRALGYLSNLKDNAPGAGPVLLSHLLAAAYPYFIASPITIYWHCAATSAELLIVFL